MPTVGRWRLDNVGKSDTERRQLTAPRPSRRPDGYRMRTHDGAIPTGFPLSLRRWGRSDSKGPRTGLADGRPRSRPLPVGPTEFVGIAETAPVRRTVRTGGVGAGGHRRSYVICWSAKASAAAVDCGEGTEAVIVAAPAYAGLRIRNGAPRCRLGAVGGACLGPESVPTPRCGPPTGRSGSGREFGWDGETLATASRQYMLYPHSKSDGRGSHEQD